MKSYINLFFLLICPALLYAQSTDDERLQSVFAENGVQAQEQWNYKYTKAGEPQESGYLNVKKYYDKQGLLIKEEYYRNGSVYQYLTYEYDNKNRKTGHENRKYEDNSFKLIYKQKISYDTEGNKLQEARFNGITISLLNYTYTDGKIQSITKRDKSGTILSKREFSHDGNRETVNIYEGLNNLQGKIINTYDDQGNLTETVEFDPPNTEKIKITYEYNDQNKLTQKSKWVGGNFIYREEYMYNNQSALTRIIKETEKESEYTNNMYQYDDKGKLVEEKWYDNHPDDYSSKEYSYNENGLPTQVEVYYAPYNYRVLYKFKYSYY